MDAVIVPSQQLIEREPVTGSRRCDQLVVVGLDCDAASVTNEADPTQPSRLVLARQPIGSRAGGCDLTR